GEAQGRHVPPRSRHRRRAQWSGLVWLQGGSMEVKVDLRVLELLSSRLCHDLISPIGAVNNGLELLEDEGSDMGDDALKLSIKSARRAADLLQAFRVALGAAGNQASVRLADARSLAAGLLEGGK